MKLLSLVILVFEVMEVFSTEEMVPDYGKGGGNEASKVLYCNRAFLI